MSGIITTLADADIELQKLIDTNNLTPESVKNFISRLSLDAGNDLLNGGAGINRLMKGNDLLLQYGDSEFITINNQKNEANQIEKFELSDGNYLNNTDIDRIIQQLSAYSKDHGISLQNNSQIQNNQALMNIITSSWHQ
ncbi:MAG: hypothetical protein AB7D20_07145 [Sulfuricurvum sp.]|uniref:hypothetical protein n=1 Tax=Sulfuricurvum sp. TaxID=2025608 RepID=UPI003D119254